MLLAELGIGRPVLGQHSSDRRLGFEIGVGGEVRADLEVLLQGGAVVASYDVGAGLGGGQRHFCVGELHGRDAIHRPTANWSLTWATGRLCGRDSCRAPIYVGRGADPDAQPCDGVSRAVFVRGRGSTPTDAPSAGPNERVRQTHVRTYSPKPGDVQREWHVIDATDVVLGKLAVQAANLLRGKHKPTFAPHMDMGDFVIVVNAEKVALTGDKLTKQAPLPPLRLPGRPHRHPRGQAAGEGRPQGHRGRRVGDAPQEQARPPDAEEAQGVRRPDPPAPGPAGQAVRDHAGLPVTPPTTPTAEQTSEGTSVADDTTTIEGTTDGLRRHREPRAFTTDEQGVAYTSESAAAADPARPATIAPAAATGRRKEAVARVRIVPGTGVWTINGRALDSYFPNKLHQQVVNEPFAALQLDGRFDVIARIHGGGITGQAGALRLGVARALNAIDVEANRPTLKKAGLLTRDARVIERKKAGLKKARKAPQFSKR